MNAVRTTSPDSEADSTDAEEAAESSARCGGAIREEAVNGVADDGGVICVGQCAIEANEQCQRRSGRCLSTPIDDELFDTWIEVAVAER
jgi:hypothetical protein